MLTCIRVKRPYVFNLNLSHDSVSELMNRCQCANRLDRSFFRCCLCRRTCLFPRDDYAFRFQVCFKPGIGKPQGCRALTRLSLDRMCSRAKCTILHQISNDYLDAYVLSESSLFVYPHKASADASANGLSDPKQYRY